MAPLSASSVAVPPGWRVNRTAGRAKDTKDGYRAADSARLVHFEDWASLRVAWLSGKVLRKKFRPLRGTVPNDDLLLQQRAVSGWMRANGFALDIPAGYGSQQSGFKSQNACASP
jgi:hypothetical protein